MHTSFSLAATTTGRLASSDPNLQNIPVRTKEGRRIREAFVAEAGSVLVSLDYSQIELRMLAHMAGIEALRTAFHEGHDIHAMTASEVFGVPIEGMDPMVRRRAKAINFGVIYGISEHGLSIQLGISRREARAFINAYFERFPGIRAYMRETVALAREQGYVETLFGRRVHTPDINEKGPRRAFQERAAINAPIQGGAADIIRRAMTRIPAALRDAGPVGTNDPPGSRRTPVRGARGGGGRDRERGGADHGAGGGTGNRAYRADCCRCGPRNELVGGALVPVHGFASGRGGGVLLSVAWTGRDMLFLGRYAGGSWLREPGRCTHAARTSIGIIRR